MNLNLSQAMAVPQVYMGLYMYETIKTEHEAN